MDDLDGQLGMILGAVVSALRKSGHSVTEIHEWIDVANASYEVMAKVGSKSA